MLLYETEGRSKPINTKLTERDHAYGIKPMKEMKKCICCEKDFWYDTDNAKWDYSNYTPVQIIECPNCSVLQAVNFEEEKDVNSDGRFYLYP